MGRSFIQVRSVSKSERETLRKKLKNKKLSVRIYQRYRIINESSKGYRAPMISERIGCAASVVYQWIRSFNEQGFKAFELPTNPHGRPQIITRKQIDWLIRTVTSKPADLGLPFTVWSVQKLLDYGRQQRMVPDISNEWVRRVLRSNGISVQRTKTWKESTDPKYEVKKTEF